MLLFLAVGATALPLGTEPHTLVVLGQSNSSFAPNDDFVHAEECTAIRGSCFWPKVCELDTNTPRKPLVTASQNSCGCIESESDLDPGYGLPDWGHTGCKSGPNPVSAVFDKYPWCFMKNSHACPAAYLAGDDPAYNERTRTPYHVPAMRQCGNGLPTGRVSNAALYDPCTGSECGTTSFRHFLKDWAAPEVFEVFEQSGELLPASSSVSWSGRRAIFLPLGMAKENQPAGPDGRDVPSSGFPNRAMTNNLLYAGQLSNGKGQQFIDGTMGTIHVPSCPVGIVPNFLVCDRPTSVQGGQCLSPLAFGEGTSVELPGEGTSLIAWWYWTRESSIFFYDGLSLIQTGPYYTDTRLAWHVATDEADCKTLCVDNSECRGYSFYRQGDWNGKNCKLSRCTPTVARMTKSRREVNGKALDIATYAYLTPGDRKRNLHRINTDEKPPYGPNYDPTQPGKFVDAPNLDACKHECLVYEDCKGFAYGHGLEGYFNSEGVAIGNWGGRSCKLMTEKPTVCTSSHPACGRNTWIFVYTIVSYYRGYV